MRFVFPQSHSICVSSHFIPVFQKFLERLFANDLAFIGLASSSMTVARILESFLMIQIWKFVVDRLLCKKIVAPILKFVTESKKKSDDEKHEKAMRFAL